MDCKGKSEIGWLFWINLLAVVCLFSIATGTAWAVTVLPGNEHRVEPTWHKSGLTLKDGGALWDHELAAIVYGNDGINNTNDKVIYTFGQCFAAGFIDDVCYEGRDLSKPRTNVVLAAGSEYFESGWARGGRRKFLQPWQEAVNGEHGADNKQMLKAFNYARDNDYYGPTNKTDRTNWENPQYYAGAAGLNTATLDPNGYAVLFVGKANMADDKKETEVMYDILTKKKADGGQYEYPAANVKVLYSDAGIGMPAVPVYGDATKAILEKVFKDDLKFDPAKAEQLFFWGYDHGSHETRDEKASFAVQKADAATPRKGPAGGPWEGHPAGCKKVKKIIGGVETWVIVGDHDVYKQSRWDTADAKGAIGDVFLGKKFNDTLTINDDTLKLADGDQLDAISPGNDGPFGKVYFSVMNLTGPDGRADTAVRKQSDRGEHSGDIYSALLKGKNTLEMEESELGLFSRLTGEKNQDGVASTSDKLDDDNLYALEKTTPFSSGSSIYFSLEGSWTIYDGTKDKILQWRDGATTRDLECFDLAMTLSDDIDAMALNLGGDHYFDSGKDWILYSLRKSANNLGADLWLSRADGDSILYARAEQLGLEIDDEIDGLDVVPEPLTMLGVFLGVCSLGRYVRRRRLV